MPERTLGHCHYPGAPATTTPVATAALIQPTSSSRATISESLDSRGCNQIRESRTRLRQVGHV
jgi:hypothetical protein